MTADERLNAIEQALDYDELHEAMDGYYAEAVAQYPRLEGCAPLAKCLGGGVYTHAVVDLQAFEKNVGEVYPDAQRVLAAAAAKHAEFGGQVPLDLPHR